MTASGRATTKMNSGYLQKGEVMRVRGYVNVCGVEAAAHDMGLFQLHHHENYPN